MPSFPLSLRWSALPIWGILRLREGLFSRGRPVLTTRVTGREPLPSAQALREVASAPEVRALHLVVEHLVGGWATLREAREALLAIRAAGKLVLVELEHCGNAELYLASAADRVWLRPMGEVQALGVGATLRFAGDALARFGFRFDVEAAGAYKAAGETFTRRFASAENREAMAAVVDGLQEELVRGVAAGRHLDPAMVRSAIESGPLSAAEAQGRGLVDGVAYPDAVKKELEALFGGEVRRRSLRGWLRRRLVRLSVERWVEDRPRVVVVHVEGPVVDGDGPPGAQVIAAEPSCRVLEALAEDSGVVAVVLAVQSPGGSALASDRIWRSVQRLVQKKVVVAAFRDVAASGGYYIAAPAAEIFVSPNTITGSIGVVGGKLVVADALARLGVHTELVVGAPEAGMYGAFAAFTPAQREKFRASLTRFYRAFVERVAAGRNRSYDAVEPFARGRVWTGTAAVANGLADHLGGVGDAVVRAASLAGRPDAVRVDVRVGPPASRLRRLIRSWVGMDLPLDLLEISPLTRFLLSGTPGPLALWPFEVDVR